MTQTVQHTDSSSAFSILVTFTWGDSSIARYCRWTEDITVDAETFISVPTLSAKLKKAMEGSTNAEDAQVTLPITLAPLTTAILPYKHSPVRVKIEEVVPGVAGTRRTLYFGRVGRIKVSPSGSGGLARIQVRGIKARLAETRIGMQALTTCAHTFGQGDCLFDLAANKEIFIPTAFFHGSIPNRIQGTVVGSPDMDNERWARGYLKFDGVSITIRKIESEGTNPNPTVTIDLREVPPPSWATQQVDIFPGCKKTIPACTDPFRAQESQFLGAGTAMLAYNPGFSDDPNA